MIFVMQNTSSEDKEGSRVVRLFMKIGGSPPLDPEERRRRILVVLFLLIMIIFPLAFSVYHLYSRHYSIVAWDFLGFFLSLSILLYLRKTGKIDVVNWMAGSGIILFGSVTTIVGRTENSIFFWAFVLPIACFAMTGKKKGLVFSLLYFFINIFLMTAPEQMMRSAPYSSPFVMRFNIIYILITIATYYYESSHKMMLTDIQEREEKYRNILENMQEGYFEVDLAGNYTFFNDSLCRIHGYPREELTGMNNRQYTDKETAKKVYQAFNKVYQTGEPLPEVDWQITTKDGNKRYIDASISSLEDSSGKPIGFRGVLRDITERKLAEERINYLATHDTLTELPNRMMFSQLLNQAIRSAKRHQRQFAVLFIDLDRFKIINDTMGHDAGDQLLQEMAKRFRQSLRAVDVVGRPKEKDDIVGRLGGDEFIILIEEMTDLSHVATVAQKILNIAMKPMVLLGEECRVTASIGISVYPRDGEDEQTLMKNADMAMYFAKEEGKNNFQFYSQNTQSHAFERFSIETNLRRALERNELYLDYQAKLDFKTGMITGVEALLRWQNPLLGSITPTQFIPVAEETGLIVPIGRWVLKTACAQNVAWQRQGLPPVRVAVNLSLRQLMDDKLIEDIKVALDDSGMAPNLLELEITESMIMFKTDRMMDVLTKIKGMGVRLALDDFGTGYSSLAQIKHLPIDTLKVDRSFVRNLAQDSEDRAIIEAIIAMGKTLSLNVIAEGVETVDQDKFLREHVCDEMQGFYFSKPVAHDQFADLLRKHNTSSLKKSF